MRRPVFQQYFPSLACLRAFEATARHLSFTRAAIELNVTQTAISHRIKTLEELLGVKLFVRDTNNVKLSEAGHEYLSTVRSAITMISTATNRAMDYRSADIVSVTSHVNFTLRYLIPSLHDFRSRHPGVTVRIGTVSSFENLLRHDYDVAIRYGTGDWPRMESYRISPDECFPVCSPRLLQSEFGLRTPDDLRHHTLIRSASHILGDEWTQWVETAGLKNISFANEIVCDFLFASVQAAVHGLGVVMGRTSVVSIDLAEGQLVEPFSVRLPLASGYHVVATPENMLRPAVQTFRDWVLERFGSKHLPQKLAAVGES